MQYEDFLRSKRLIVPSAGISAADSDIHSVLFPFQRDLVRWALRKGRAAIFADCGLAKHSCSSNGQDCSESGH